jgi:hypothetical protein
MWKDDDKEKPSGSIRSGSNETVKVGNAESLIGAEVRIPEVVPEPWNRVEPAVILSQLPEELLDYDLIDCGLNEQARKTLARLGISKVRQLREYSLKQLMRRPRIGHDNVAAIIQCISEFSRRHRSMIPDIATVLANLPEYLLAGPIQLAHLDRRTAAALERNNILTYEQLRNYTSERLLALPGFETLVILRLVQYIREMPPVQFAEMLRHHSKLTNPSADQASEEAVKCISLMKIHLECIGNRRNATRLGQLLLEYWGNWNSLAHTARDLDIPSDRARQMITAYAEQLASISEPSLRRKIDALMEGRLAPLYLYCLPVGDAWFGDLELLPANCDRYLYMARMIAAVLKNYHAVTLGGKDILARARQTTIDTVVSDCLHQASADSNLKELRSIIAAVCAEREIPELADHFLREVLIKLE